MRSRSLTVLIGVAAVVAAGALEPVRAGQRVTSPRGVTARSSSAGVGSNATAVITGQALKADQTPLPFARLRLRDLDSSALIDRTSADHVGEFSFELPAAGDYLVELCDDGGQVLAVSGALTVEAGEAVGAIIILPSQLPTFGGLFANTAASVVSAAAGAGITAVSATGVPVSPEQ